MALRASNKDPSSPRPGLRYYWRDLDKHHTRDCNQWIQLFEVVVLVKQSIAVQRSIAKTPNKTLQENRGESSLLCL